MATTYYLSEKVSLNNESSFTVEVTDGIVTGVTNYPDNGDAAAEADNRNKAALLGQPFVADEYDSQLDPNDNFDAESIAHYSASNCPNFLRKGATPQ